TGEIGSPLWQAVGWKQRPAEESQLKTEPAALGGLQVAGVIPPLGLKGVVRAMIARKLPGIPWLGALETGNIVHHRRPRDARRTRRRLAQAGACQQRCDEEANPGAPHSLRSASTAVLRPMRQ